MSDACDVLIIGGGPAGLAAATRLKRLGVGSVVLVEREMAAGGIPRHCLHSPFGMREFGRVLGGPAYARALARRAEDAGVEMRLGTTIVRIGREGGLVTVMTSDRGVERLAAKRILLATGAREMPRSARLVSGDRPLGVMNTGALQFHAGKGLAPFRRPLIVGSELVSLSALLTCRALGARPVMMIEERSAPFARSAFMLLPRLLGIPVRCNTRIADLRGGARVESVALEHADGRKSEVDCDGVVFTGRFTPESSLASAVGLDIDPHTDGPAIDQFGRTSDPSIFAVGNLLHPIETAGWCWAEARQLAGFIADSLAGRLPSPETSAPVRIGPGIAYAVPQRIAGGGTGIGRFQIRVAEPAEGRLVADDAQTRKMGARRRLLPERRLILPIPAPSGANQGIAIGIED